MRRRPSGHRAKPGGGAFESGGRADSEDAFGQAAVAPRDGRRGAGGRLTGRLGVTDALLFLGGIDDDAAGLRILPEDQAVDEALVVVGNRLGVLIDPAADIGIGGGATG